MVCWDGYVIVNGVVGSGVTVEFVVGIVFMSCYSSGINSSSASSLFVGLSSLLLPKMTGAGSAQIDTVSLIGVGCIQDVVWIVAVVESASFVREELFTFVLSVIIFGLHVVSDADACRALFTEYKGGCFCPSW